MADQVTYEQILKDNIKLLRAKIKSCPPESTPQTLVEGLIRHTGDYWALIRAPKDEEWLRQSHEIERLSKAVGLLQASVGVRQVQIGKATIGSTLG